MKIFAYLGAAILIILGLIAIFFGVLFIWGAFSPDGSTSWIGTGVFTVIIGFALFIGAGALIWYAGRAKASSSEISVKLDLPANVNMDTLKCKSCGGSLTLDNIKLVAGAPVVNCPYCHTTYQFTEDPKW